MGNKIKKLILYACDPIKYQESGVRIIYWTLGLFLGLISAYTTRHFINGDAITYFDMALAFRSGEWEDVANLHYSPGYPLFLAVLGYVFQSSDYLFLAKGLNIICFVAAMGACDIFVTHANQSLQLDSKGKALPTPLFAGICYAGFLLSSLGWVKIQIISPDMLVFAVILLSCLLLLKISEAPERTSLYLSLGFLMGLGYLLKTFLFPFSVLFFLLAASLNRSFPRAFGRFLVGISVMLVISAPGLISSSWKAGKFSYGEAGTFNYTYFVSGQGESVNKPEIIHNEPLTTSYNKWKVYTYPRGADLAYWTLGVRPVFNLSAQLSAIRKNLDILLGKVFLPVLAIVVWLLLQWWRGGVTKLEFYPPSPPVMFGTLSLAGILMFCLVLVESRYVAPFVFLGFVSLAWLPRYCNKNCQLEKKTFAETLAVIAIFMGLLIQTLADQTIRCNKDIDGKGSHYSGYLEAKSVCDYLKSSGVNKGDQVAIISPFTKNFYWANSAGVRITAEIDDAKDFVNSGDQKRAELMIALSEAGIKSVVGTDPSLKDFVDEGWTIPNGAPNYFVNCLESFKKNSIDTRQR